MVRVIAVGVVLTGATVASASPYSEIREAAAREWPHDFAMQRYEIERQTKAYLAMSNYTARDVKPDVLKRILERARYDWPENYVQQQYQTRQQVEAYRRVYGGFYVKVPKEIVEDAAEEWPDDFNMQEYEIKRQAKAYRKLQQAAH